MLPRSRTIRCDLRLSQHFIKPTTVRQTRNLNLTSKASSAHSSTKPSSDPKTAAASMTTAPRQATPDTKTTDTTTQAEEPPAGTVSTAAAEQPQATKSHAKTQAELDEQMRAKMADLSGDGGEAGLEMEDGHVKGIGRGVRDNMFRYI